MKTNKKFSIIFGIILALFVMLISVNAAADFSVSPSSISKTEDTSKDITEIITITNTGNESLNLTLSDTDLTSGSSTIGLSLNSTTITNLEPNGIKKISVTYNTGTVEGNFTGSITIIDDNNSSLTQTINFNLTINENNSVSGHSVMFEGFGSTITMEINVDDSREKETYYLVNNGDVTIYNIEIDLDSSFDGDDDRIDDDDFEINGEDGSDTFSSDEDSELESLAPGEKYKIALELDIPSSLDVDDYKGDIDISYEVDGVRYTQTFTLKIIAESDDEDVEIDKDSLYVKNGVLKVFAEPGEYVTDVYFTVFNDASYDIEDLTVTIEDDFEEEDSARIMSKSVVEFDPYNFTVFDRDEEDIDLKITIPDDQPTGVYSTDIKLFSKTGKELDKITLKIEVIGDIYIASIDYIDTVKPGSYVDVTVDVHNKGSTLQRNVKVYGSLYDIDAANSDIFESSSNFLLDADSSRKETLRFKIPKDASDGSHVLEIKVDYDGNEIYKLENIDVVRPSHKILVESYAINPSIAKCDDTIYTYIKYQNLGKYDEDTQVFTEIKGTDIKASTNNVELGVDEIAQKSLILDISNLEPGTYDVVQTIKYSGISEIRESTLRIDPCSEATVGLVVKNETIDENLINNSENTKIDLFGKKIEKTTAYLGAGLGTVSLLIILALFLI